MRKVLPNILYIVHRVPYPPDKGDRIRAFHILNYLARRANVHLACLADEPVPEATMAALAERCQRLAIVGLGGAFRWLRALGAWARGRTVTEGAFSSSKLRRVLRAWAQDTHFAAVLASSSSMVPYLRLAELQDTPKVVDLVDVDSQKWRDYTRVSRWPRSWIYRSEARRLRALEHGLPAWTRAVTLVSDAEAALYREFCAQGTVRAVTNGVDLEYFQPQERCEVEPACVFVGALDYRPNVDAACWFAAQAWPHIRRRRPDAELWLVGRQPVPEVQRLGGLPGVTVVGQVPDVRPHVRRAALAIAPLRIARGLQNKLLEAMAMAKPVVSSPQALAGVKNGTPLPVLTAASVRDWVEHVVLLLDTRALRNELGQAGRSYVEAHHSWERCLAPLDALVGLNGEAGQARCATLPT